MRAWICHRGRARRGILCKHYHPEDIDFPEVAEMFEAAKLDDAQYGSLEDLVVNEYGEGQEADAVDAWLEENADWRSTLS